MPLLRCAAQRNRASHVCARSHSMDRVNVVIIGGGVVGCAIAYELSGRIEDIFLLEQSPRLGMATSTRNSGVIHSGIYYPPEFLKARFCVEGNRLTKEFCAAQCVVNSAGLYADEIAALLGNHRYRIYPVRGEYAEVVRARADLVNALVYPLPHHDRLSLGVHLTKTLWGTVLVGPTAHYVDDKNDYEHNRLPLEEFLLDACGLLPELRLEDLRLAYSGIRPKLVPPGGQGIADFVIARDHTYPRAIHLVGIESPGLTSAPAIARHVAALVSETLD